MFDFIMTVSTRVPVPDTVALIGKQPAQLLGGDRQYAHYEPSSELDLGGFAPHLRTMGELYPTRCGVLGNSCQQGARVDSKNSILQRLYASYIQKESNLGKVEHFCQQDQAFSQQVPP